MLNMLVVGTLPIYLPQNQVPAVFGDPYTDVGFTNTSANITIPGYAAEATVGDTLQFTTTGTLPTNFAVATTYYVVSVSGANVTVSATSGGGAITAGSAGTGTHTAHILSEVWQGVPYCLKPNNTVLVLNGTSGSLNLQSAADNSGGSGDPTGPGSFTTIVAVPAIGSGGLAIATLNNDWIQASGSQLTLIGA